MIPLPFVPFGAISEDEDDNEGSEPREEAIRLAQEGKTVNQRLSDKALFLFLIHPHTPLSCRAGLPGSR